MGCAPTIVCSTILGYHLLGVDGTCGFSEATRLVQFVHVWSSATLFHGKARGKAIVQKMMLEAMMSKNLDVLLVVAITLLHVVRLLLYDVICLVNE